MNQNGQALPRPPSWILKGEKGKGNRKREGKGKKRRGGKDATEH